MNSFWMVAIVFLFVIVSPVLLAWIIETGVSRLGAIIVVGSRSLYRSEEETIAFFGKRFEAITRARGRVLLVDGLDVRALKEPDAEEALSVDELAALVSRQSSGLISNAGSCSLRRSPGSSLELTACARGVGRAPPA